MRTTRLAAAAAALAAVLAVGGCVILPPPLPGEITLPPTTPLPVPSPTTQPQQGEALPVEPDEPITDADETGADTGELYAGSRGETVDGYLPDAAFDMVLEPTRGTAAVQPGIALPVHDGGDELLPGEANGTSRNLLLSTVGRLELSTSEGDFTCTGTVINSDSGLIVATAAHCIFDDETRDWYDRILFAPGYERGDTPYGVWEAERWWVPEQYLEANTRWLDGADDDGWMGFDFGFIRFAPQGGRTLEQVVGGQGISFTAETNGVVIAGYPGNDPFDSEVLRHCAEDRLNYGAGGDANYGADCVMGDGASGSGWVSNVDPATGAGHITAVYSNGGDTGAYGPPLGVTAWNGLQSLD
ncbi:MAG: trypsin-like serine peptidase [Actinomycetes bacterium]